MEMNVPELNSTGLRKFAFTAAGLLVAVFGLALPWLNGYTRPGWPLIIALALVLWGLLLPESLGPLYRGWMRIALVLGKVNTYLILIAVFFFVFIPVGIVMRIIGYDPMQRKFSATARSYRNTSIPPLTKHMERPF